MQKKKFNKGTGHALAFALILIYALVWIICKIMGLDAQSSYEVMIIAAGAPILAIGIELGMELSKEDN